MLDTHNWQYLHGIPDARAVLKAAPEDFRVTEILGYEPCSEGEHIYLWCEKTNLNTAFVAEQLAKFAGLPLRAVSYAGRKDKHAVTRQWFGVHLPGKAMPVWENLALPGLRVLDAKRHNKKLRTGVLKGNRFDIRLRNLTESESLETRIALIAQHGVPNYFGPQRFGDTRHHPQGGNLALAEKMLAGEAIRNRNKRSMAISALRSWLFNEFVSRRLAEGLFNQPMSGDTLILSGSNSFFIAEQLDDTLSERLQQGDIGLSAPMWGAGPLPTRDRAQAWENTVAGHYPEVCQGLAGLGLKQERRTIGLAVTDLDWKIGDDSLTISFSLPAGAFATSVLRELVQLEPAEDSDENSAE